MPVSRRVWTAVLAILCLSGGACAPEPSPAPTTDAAVSASVELQALRTADSALQRAIADRNVERTVAFYADDASLLPAASPLIAGKVAIREEWTKLFAIPAFSNSTQLGYADVATSGDLGYTRGTYSTRLTGHDNEPLTERGKWVSIWRKQSDGQWRIIVDIYNTDTPPPDHL